MSHDYEIFVSSDQDIDTFTRDLGEACGNPVRHLTSGPWAYSAYTDYGAVEVLLDEEFDDDLGIPFSQYDILVTVRDFDSDPVRQERTARNLFSSLKGKNRYSLILTYEMQRLLDASPPIPGREVDRPES